MNKPLQSSRKFFIHSVKNISILLTICLIFLFGSQGEAKAQFGSGNIQVRNLDPKQGKISFDVIRFIGGNRIKHVAYMEYKNKKNEWQQISQIRHWCNGGSNSYSKPGGDCGGGNRYRAAYSAYASTYDLGEEFGIHKYRVDWDASNDPNFDQYNTDIQVRLRHVSTPKENAGVVGFVSVGEVYGFGSPQNFSASKDQCGQINLKWTLPDDINNSGWSYRYYELQRRTKGTSSGWSNVSTSITSTSYVNYYRSAGVEYEYRIRYKVRKSGGNYLYGAYTLVPVVGRALPLPDAPSNVVVSSDLCDKELKVDWNYFSSLGTEHLRNFSVVYRKKGSSYAAVSTQADDLDRSVKFTVSAAGEYEVYVNAIDKCRTSSKASAVEEGIANTDPIAVTNPTATIIGTKVRLTWSGTTFASSYLIRRVNNTTGSSTDIEVSDGSLTEYLDELPPTCGDLTYTIFSKNICGSAETTANVVSVAPLGFSTALANFDVSKGFFNNKVDLSFSLADTIQLDEIRIYRKDATSNSDSVFIAAIEPSEFYSDESADAGILYKYSVTGVRFCGSEIKLTNTIEEFGFRTPSGIINGRITFTGGIAVAGAKILVDKDGGNEGYGLAFNGSTSKISLPGTLSEELTNAFLAEGWFNTSSLTSDITLFSSYTGSQTGFRLEYISATNQLRAVVGRSGSATLVVNATATNMVAGMYHHIALSMDESDSIKVYLDGIVIGKANMTGNFAEVNSEILVGTRNTNYLNGKIDELRIWNTARSEALIKRDFNRFLVGNEAGLKGYYRINEGFGSEIYDISKTGNDFNKNHGTLSNTTWSTIIPTSSLLGSVGITDANGNYNVNSILYSGTGNNFTITPTLGVHEFDPGNQVLFIGEGSQIHNGINFDDISSFKVTGTVRFEGTSCFAKDIRLLIDGQPVIKQGALVVTDGLGEFEIQVPIGEHVVSLAKEGHTFSEGRFPPDSGVFDFQDNVPGIEFVDNTKYRILGRAVGGVREGNKPLGFGKSINNIGVTEINFLSQAGAGCIDTTIFTNAVTGEYSIDLPPLKYNINKIEVGSNVALDFGPQDLIDISLNLPQHFKVDSVFDNSGTFKSIDTAYFHAIRNFIFRDNPKIDVTNADDTPLSGEDSVVVVINPTTKQSVTFDLISNPLNYDVYEETGLYNFRITAFEQYNNKDSGMDSFDRVPVTDGVLEIANGLGTGLQSTKVPGGEELSLSTGEALYVFRAGQANTLVNSIDNTLSFTKTFDVDLSIGNQTFSWEPSSGAVVYRAYVFGSKPDGKSFVTEGPKVVDYILRDPPGSNSSSTLSAGTSYSTAKNFTWNAAVGGNLELNIAAGVNAKVGVGYATELKIKASTTLTLEAELGYNGSKELVETITTTQDVSTSSEPRFVGSEADIFLGKARNYTYGVVNALNILPDSLCGLTGVVCQGASVNGFKVGTRKGLFLVPIGYETYFSFTQYHIENDVIPVLETLRNQIFEGTAYDYNSELPLGHPNYAKSNDDKVFGNSTSSPDDTRLDAADLDGPSYKFTPTSNQTDTVYMINQQIRLWKEVLKRNEQEKLQAEHVQNISFSAGASISRSVEQKNSSAVTHGYSISLAQSIISKLEVDIGGSGVSVSNSIGLKEQTTGNFKSAEENTTKVGYTLSDGNIGDFLSVDVKSPQLTVGAFGLPLPANSGPVFLTRGGETSCPYEEGTVTKYFSPGAPLDAATLRRHLPSLEVLPAIRSGVPEDEPAVFTLTLGNKSQSGDDVYYGIRVVDNSNPDGAILKIDGGTVAGSFLVPAGGTVTKQLTVRKGPVKDQYNNLQLYIYPLCDFDLSDVSAFDTVTISARFVPACSDVSLIKPANQWIVNFENNDTLDIVIGDFDVAYPDLKKLQLQYKPTTQSNWYGLQTYHLDTTGLKDPKAKLIPTANSTIFYQWDKSQLIDGPYDIRVISTCLAAEDQSTTNTGITDRIQPHNFGTPQPADGVLDPNDEIEIQFNEPILAAALTSDNFDLRGVVNGSGIRNDASVAFDGINNYISIPEGLSLNNNSFTIEFWAKRNGRGSEVMFSQGADPQNAIEIGFDASNNVFIQIGNETATGSTPIIDNQWRHYAFSFNHLTELVEILMNDKTFRSKTLPTQYTEVGRTFVGRAQHNGDRYFDGNMHNLRVWNIPRQLANVVSNMNKTISSSTLGLSSSYPMDEAFGTIITDDVHGRLGTMYADWAVFPEGKSAVFDGKNDQLQLRQGQVAFGETEDFTIEFWFKAPSQTQSVTLLSTGKADGTDGNEAGWTITATPSGKLVVKNNGLTFNAVANHDVLNNTWNHFALVVNRLGNIRSFYNGVLQNTVSASPWKGFGGSKLWLGTRGYFNGAIENTDQFYEGRIDEFRIWNTSRKKDQIARDKNSRLQGDEFGLSFYFPFENYQDVLGIPVLTQSWDNQVDGSSDSLINLGGVDFNKKTANIKLPRPVQKINFNWSTNNDRVIINTTDPDFLLENQSIDITVKNVRDLYGNKMASPVTWSAFFNLNQVKWEEQILSYEKDLYASLSFTTKIVNTGGQQQFFTIENLPGWLTATPQTGSIEALSEVEVTFEVNTGLNIGTYVQDITLETDFGFVEKLLLNLHVSPPQPDWDINPADFAYSMSLVGRVEINGVVSNDKFDKVAGFVNGQLRGVGNLQYLKAYDHYVIFLDLYSNAQFGDTIILQVFDASKGTVHTDVTPNIRFTENQNSGTPGTPVLIQATDQIAKTLPIVQGWNWLSVNINSPQLAKVNDMLSSLPATQGDEINGQFSFDQFDTLSGWFGSLTTTGGIQSDELYKLKATNKGKIEIKGVPIDPATNPLMLSAGWNWIGYLPQLNISVKEALGSLNPSAGDLIKSQNRFAVFDQNLGWLGSLEFLEPGKGYMIELRNPQTLTYPVAGTFGGGELHPAKEDNVLEQVAFTNYQQNMGLIGVIDDYLVELEKEDVIIASVDGEPVGVGFVRFNSIQNNYNVYLSISGNTNADQVSLKLKRPKTLQSWDIQEKVAFHTDANLGSVQNPVILHLGESTGILVAEGKISGLAASPNPFVDEIKVSLFVEKDAHLKITINDVLGRHLATILDADVSQGQLFIPWNGLDKNNKRVNNGLYIIRAVSDYNRESIQLIRQK